MVVAFLVGVAVTLAAGYARDKYFRASVDKDLAALHIEVLNVRAKLAQGVSVVEADWEKAKELFTSLASKL